MPTHYTNQAQLAHIFANIPLNEASDHWGRAASMFLDAVNFYHDHETWPAIYSYGTMIALRCKAPSGREVVLLNDKKYSVTTSAHQEYVASACSHLPLYRVKMCNAATRDKETHRRNHQYMIGQAAEDIGRMKRARIHTEWHFRSAVEWLNMANAYTRDFRLGFRQVSVPETIEAASEAWFEADIAKRIVSGIRRRQREHEKEMERQRKMRAERFARELEEWRNHETNYIMEAHYFPPALRRDGDEVVTSLGAKFPLEHARKAWPFIRRIADAGQKWHPNGHSIHLGMFTVEEITPEHVKAGCHTVPMDECRRFAEEMGWN